MCYACACMTGPAELHCVPRGMRCAGTRRRRPSSASVSSPPPARFMKPTAVTSTARWPQEHSPRARAGGRRPQLQGVPAKARGAAGWRRSGRTRSPAPPPSCTRRCCFRRCRCLRCRTCRPPRRRSSGTPSRALTCRRRATLSVARLPRPAHLLASDTWCDVYLECVPTYRLTATCPGAVCLSVAAVWYDVHCYFSVSSGCGRVLHRITRTRIGSPHPPTHDNARPCTACGARARNQMVDQSAC